MLIACPYNYKKDQEENLWKLVETSKAFFETSPPFVFTWGENQKLKEMEGAHVINLPSVVSGEGGVCSTLNVSKFLCETLGKPWCLVLIPNGKTVTKKFATEIKNIIDNEEDRQKGILLYTNRNNGVLLFSAELLGILAMFPSSQDTFFSQLHAAMRHYGIEELWKEIEVSYV